MNTWDPGMNWYSLVIKASFSYAEKRPASAGLFFFLTVILVNMKAVGGVEIPNKFFEII